MWSHLLVMRSTMMFRVIVCPVGLPWAPIKSKLFSGFSIPKPVESHVHCLSSLGLDVVSDHSQGCAVISLHRGRGLWMTHLFQQPPSLQTKVPQMSPQTSIFRRTLGGTFGVSPKFAKISPNVTPNVRSSGTQAKVC